MSAISNLLKRARSAGPTLGSEFDDELTRGQINFVGDQATRFGGLRSRAQASINNAVNRTRRVAGAQGASRVATQLGDQDTGARGNDAVTNALRRAKARVGVIDRGDAAARNQQLVDRLAQVKSGISAQGRAIQLQTAGQNIRAGVNIASQDARARGDAAVAGATGASLGGLAATLKSNKARRGEFFDFKLGG